MSADPFQAQQALASAKFITKSGFARVNCPYCLERQGKDDTTQSLAIGLQTGWFRCWRCHIKGRVDLDMEMIPEWTPPDPDAKVDMPEGFMSLMTEPGMSALSAEPGRSYLRGRGIQESVWMDAQIGVCVSGFYADRVVIPVPSPTGEVWGWVARSWHKEVQKRYLNASGMVMGTAGRWFNHAAIYRETDEPLIAVEGVFDALPYWPDASGALGKPTDAQVSELCQARRPVAVVLDGDAWEEAEMVALRLQFEGLRAGFVKLPPKRDPGEYDKNWIREEARRCVG